MKFDVQMENESIIVIRCFETKLMRIPMFGMILRSFMMMTGMLKQDASTAVRLSMQTRLKMEKRH
ncbi:hypothetical protein HanIR_Chr13g0636891 [Helianthus annuus]|nr:hypothetical protein HanIR_Chr13g0636891 [Helianthus annuus]